MNSFHLCIKCIICRTRQTRLPVHLAPLDITVQQTARPILTSPAQRATTAWRALSLTPSTPAPGAPSTTTLVRLTTLLVPLVPRGTTVGSRASAPPQISATLAGTVPYNLTWLNQLHLREGCVWQVRSLTWRRSFVF